MNRKIRILVADDHAIVRMGLTALIESDPELEVIGEADDGKTAVSESIRLKPDVVIMDLMMPNKDGATATGEICASVPDTKVLVLTTFGTSDGIANALAAGASGALMKSVANEELLSAIHAIHAGERIVSDEISKLIADDPPARELTERQAEILRSVIRGLTNRDIAAQLDISPEVVKNHLNAIFSKIGAANRTEAVAIALRKHLLKI